jgi:hypothetical protein
MVAGLAFSAKSQMQYLYTNINGTNVITGLQDNFHVKESNSVFAGWFNSAAVSPNFEARYSLTVPGDGYLHVDAQNADSAFVGFGFYYKGALAPDGPINLDYSALSGTVPVTYTVTNDGGTPATVRCDARFVAAHSDFTNSANWYIV